MKPTERTALGRQVGVALRRPVSKVFVGPSDDQKLAALASEIQRIRPRQWADNPTAATVATLRAVIARLPDVEAPRRGAPSSRTLGQVLIGDDNETGADSGEKTIYQTAHQSRVARLRRLLGVSNSELDRVLVRLYEQIAELLASTPGLAVRGTEDADTVERYVRRGSIETLIWTSAYQRDLAIVLWGESGNGKTTTAGVMAHEVWGSNCPVVRGPTRSRTSPYEGDVIALLRDSGVDARAFSSAGLSVALKELLATPESVAGIVLDNIEVAALQDLLESPPAVPVIATTRDRPSGFRCHVIRVDEYTADEASSATVRLGVDSADDRVQDLIRLLGRRPVALELAVRIVLNGHQSLDELVEACARSVPDTLDAAFQLSGEDVSPPLVEVYRRALEQIAEEDVARRVLSSAIWLSSDPNVENLRRLSLASDGSRPDRLAFSAALDRLEASGFIRIESSTVRINDLTVAILRPLTLDMLDATAQRYFEVISDLGSRHELDAVTQDDVRRYSDSLASISPAEVDEQLIAFDVEGQRAWIRYACPGVDIGVTALTQKSWLSWREISMDGGRRVAPTVVTVETVETLPPGGSFNLWSGAGARHPSREEAVLFYALVNVSNGVSEAWLNALLRGQVFSEGAPIGIVGLRDGEPFRHRPVTFLPRGAIRALAGVWTWNRCGLFAPVAAAAEDLPRCPACDEYKDQPFGKEWPNFLLALETLMDWSSSADPLVRIANEAALVECASDETSARFNHARHAAVAGLDLLRSESAESNGVTLAVLAIVMSGFCGGGVEWLYDIHQSLAEIYSRSPGRFEVKDLRAMQILAQAWNSYGDVEHEQVQIRLTRLRESVGDALYFPFAVSDGIQQLAEISPQLFPPDGEYG